MNTLVLKLLGSPQFSLNGHPITHLISRKAQALLIYVAVTGRQHSREMLAELFWQNMPSNQSMKNLRTVLPNLRQVVGSHLIITRQTILFNRECSYCLDVEAVEAIADHPETDNFQSLSAAVMQYQGDFLEGFYVPNAPDFETWAFMERERLRALAIEGLHALAEQHLKRHNYTAGLSVTRKLLTLDPWRETAHQQQMVFLSCTGQRLAALTQYDICRQMLADEFKVEPMAETIAIYEQIRSGEGFGAEAMMVETARDDHGNSNLTLSLMEPLSLQHLIHEPDQSKLENLCDNDKVESKFSLPASSSSDPELSQFPYSRCDWGEAVDVSIFYGRETELLTLQQWIVRDHYRLILLLGIGGIGKTALSVKLAQTVQAEFEYVIWRSLRNAPPLESLLADLVPFLSDQQDNRAEIGRLIHWLRTHRCLIILDNVETLFQEGNRVGQYRSGYKDYGELFKVIGEVQHQSCVLLTGREKPTEVAGLEGDLAARTFLVTGSLTTAQALLETRGLLGSQAQKQQLAKRYGYNPFALKIVASSIQDLMDGDVEAFLKQEVVLFNGIRQLLAQQIDRLSALEQSIMYWLAINREWTTIAELSVDIVPRVPQARLFEALESLSWRDLIERRHGSYTQQPVVMEYITSLLVEKVGNEIVDQEINLFDNHALLKMNVKEYIRETQQRLILAEVANQVQIIDGTSAHIEIRLQKILKLLQSRAASPAYAAGNLINLCGHLQIDLTGYDFSQLILRHAHLQGKWLQSVNFQDSQFETSLFTQIVKVSFALAFSPDGKLLAHGDGSGNIFVRRVVDGELLLSWQGHCNTIWTLVWSPDGKIFATGSNGSIIRIWNPYTGECLQEMQTTSVVWAVAWSMDGQRIISGSNDRTIRVWDAKNGQCLQQFQMDAWIMAIAPNPNGKILAVGGADCTVYLFDLETGERLKALSGHTNWIWSVAWSPDGQTLATGSEDGTVRLWDAQTGDCLQVLQVSPVRIFSVVWSPNGQILACGGSDPVVQLWDVNTGRCIQRLEGHTSSLWAVAWQSAGQLLASSGEDDTIRIWEVNTGRCLKTLRADRPYEGMNITDVTGSTEAQKTNLKVLGAVEKD